MRTTHPEEAAGGNGQGGGHARRHSLALPEAKKAAELAEAKRRLVAFSFQSRVRAELLHQCKIGLLARDKVSQTLCKHHQAPLAVALLDVATAEAKVWLSVTVVAWLPVLVVVHLASSSRLRKLRTMLVPLIQTSIVAAAKAMVELGLAA